MVEKVIVWRALDEFSLDYSLVLNTSRKCRCGVLIVLIQYLLTRVSNCV